MMNRSQYGGATGSSNHSVMNLDASTHSNISQQQPMFASGSMPSALQCKLCGKQFFEKSFPFHLKTCAKNSLSLTAAELENIEKIGQCIDVNSGDRTFGGGGNFIEKYCVRPPELQKTSSSRSPFKNLQRNSSGFSGANTLYTDAESGGPEGLQLVMGGSSLSSFKSSFNTTFQTDIDHPPTNEPLVQCRWCNRSFIGSRISYHESVCERATRQDEIRRETLRSRERGRSLERSLERKRSLSQQQRSESQRKRSASRTKENFREAENLDNGENLDKSLGKDQPGATKDDSVGGSLVRREIASRGQSRGHSRGGNETRPTQSRGQSRENLFPSVSGLELQIYSGGNGNSMNGDSGHTDNVGIGNNNYGGPTTNETVSPTTSTNPAAGRILTRCPSRPSASRDGVFYFTALNTVTEKPSPEPKKNSKNRPYAGKRWNNNNNNTLSSMDGANGNPNHGMYNSHSLAILDNVNNFSVAVGHFPRRRNCGARRFFSQPVLLQIEDHRGPSVERKRDGSVERKRDGSVERRRDSSMERRLRQDQGSSQNFASSFSDGFKHFRNNGINNFNASLNSTQGTQKRTVRFSSEGEGGGFREGGGGFREGGGGLNRDVFNQPENAKLEKRPSLILKNSKRFAGITTNTKAARNHASEWGGSLAVVLKDSGGVGNCRSAANNRGHYAGPGSMQNTRFSGGIGGHTNFASSMKGGSTSLFTSAPVLTHY